MWTLEDGELHVTFEKARRGEAWPGAFEGHGGEGATGVEEDRRRLMLQRFQEENPGFDFSSATFSGSVPDAATFMGGVKSGK